MDDGGAGGGGGVAGCVGGVHVGVVHVGFGGFLVGHYHGLVVFVVARAMDEVHDGVHVHAKGDGRGQSEDEEEERNKEAHLCGCLADWNWVLKD